MHQASKELCLRFLAAHYPLRPEHYPNRGSYIEGSWPHRMIVLSKEGERLFCLFSPELRASDEVARVVVDLLARNLPFEYCGYAAEHKYLATTSLPRGFEPWLLRHCSGRTDCLVFMLKVQPLCEAHREF